MNGERSGNVLVSILVRSTDRDTLSRALNSAANQTWPHIEIVVVGASGASHQALPTTWEGRSLRFLPAAGPLSRPVAANILLASARGKYLNFLDDDDDLMPHHVESLVDGLEASPSTRVAYSICRVFDETGNDVGRLGKPGHHLLMFHQNRFAIHAAMFSRQLVDQGIRFDPSFDRMEDLDFFVACGARTDFLFVPTVTCTWHAFTGSSGMGYSNNADKPLQEQATRRVREKWRKQFERWGREPEGILAVAESALKFGQNKHAATLLQKISRCQWPIRALAERYERAVDELSSANNS